MGVMILVFFFVTSFELFALSFYSNSLQSSSSCLFAFLSFFHTDAVVLVQHR